jgi:hypothetical protein
LLDYIIKKYRKNKNWIPHAMRHFLGSSRSFCCFKTKTKLNSLPEGGAAMLAVETEARCIDDGGFQAGKQREFIYFACLFLNPMRFPQFPGGTGDGLFADPRSIR